MARTLTVLKVSPGKHPEIVTIPHHYLEMQRLVGGTVQTIYPWEDAVALCCNDDGKIMHLSPNRAVFMRDDNVTGLLDEPLPGILFPYNELDESGPGELADVIVGDFFVCGIGGEDFCDLTPEQLERFQKRFWYPERFLRINGVNTVVRCDFTW